MKATPRGPCPQIHPTTPPSRRALMAVLALVLLSCDADEGRDPARPSLALTAAMETTSGGGEETTTSSASTSTSTSTSSTSTTATSTTSSTSSGGLGESTSSESTSTMDDGSSSGGDTTGEDLTTSTTSTTTGEEPPCPCTAEIVSGQNLCAQEPTPDCPATLPGGICDPDGDGSFADGDWIAGYHGYLEACA